MKRVLAMLFILTISTTNISNALSSDNPNLQYYNAVGSKDLLRRLAQESKLELQIYKKQEQEKTNKLIEAQSKTINNKTKLENYKLVYNSNNIPRTEMEIKKEILKRIPMYLGIPYVWGGNTLRGLDCSGFTVYLYRQLGVNLPRNSRQQGKVGELVMKGDLQIGDLLFFDTRKGMPGNNIKTTEDRIKNAIKEQKGEKESFISHVGIYIGDNKMVHASYTSNKIIIADLTEGTYWDIRFLHGRRVLNNVKK